MVPREALLCQLMTPDEQELWQRSVVLHEVLLATAISPTARADLRVVQLSALTQRWFRRRLTELYGIPNTPLLSDDVVATLARLRTSIELQNESVAHGRTLPSRSVLLAAVTKVRANLAHVITARVFQTPLEAAPLSQSDRMLVYMTSPDLFSAPLPDAYARRLATLEEAASSMTEYLRPPGSRRDENEDDDEEDAYRRRFERAEQQEDEDVF